MSMIHAWKIQRSQKEKKSVRKCTRYADMHETPLIGRYPIANPIIGATLIITP